MPTSREGQRIRRPKGWPGPDDFRLAEIDVRQPRDGEALVRNVVMSVDPYMRGRMNDAKSYAAPYQLDQPMYGGWGGGRRTEGRESRGGGEAGRGGGGGGGGGGVSFSPGGGRWGPGRPRG